MTQVRNYMLNLLKLLTRKNERKMKKLKFTLPLLLIPLISIGQGDLYYAKPTTQYVGQDIGGIEAIAKKSHDEYENKKAYRDQLIDWIIDLKTKNSDRQFIDAMDVNLIQLYGIDLLENIRKLDEIKMNVKKEIDNCNTRVREVEKREAGAPKKLWESGNENLKNQNYNQAIKDYTDFIKLDDSFEYVYKNRGIAYSRLGKYQLAISDLDKFIEVKSDDPYSYYIRGWVKYYIKDFMGSLSDFNKQIDLEPNAPEAYFNRGSAKSALGDKIGAIADFTKAIELKFDYSMAYNNRGWAKFTLKKYSEALIDINKAIEFDPTNWVAYDSRQETKFALNDFKGCFIDCTKAIELNPKCSNSHFYRGRAYYKQGNKTKACEDWSKAGELGNAEAYEFISKYCK